MWESRVGELESRVGQGRVGGQPPGREDFRVEACRVGGVPVGAARWMCRPDKGRDLERLTNSNPEWQ